MSIKYEYSVSQKLDIMKGVFHNMECGMARIKEINPTFNELEGYHMLANQFSSAWIFELAIKSLWELSHSKGFDTPEIKQYGHCIHNIYPCLKKEFCDFISNEYKVEVTKLVMNFKRFVKTSQVPIKSSYYHVHISLLKKPLEQTVT